jgi:Fur family transcriptional regulator, ferric uptake regulator
MTLPIPAPDARLEQATERLRQHLHGRRLRLTAERQSLLRAVMMHAGHFDADEIAARLRRGRSPHASRATVYRTLVLLEECGILRKSPVSRLGRSVYENAIGRDHHDHIVCAACGRIEEFYEERVEKLQDEIAGRFGFRVTKHVHEIVGFCSRCDPDSAGKFHDRATREDAVSARPDHRPDERQG